MNKEIVRKLRIKPYMPSLSPRKLGTSRDDSPVNWAVHQTGSYLVEEFFCGSYYRDCLNLARGVADSNFSMALFRKQNLEQNFDRLIKLLEDLSAWAKEVHHEGFHTVNTHVFITLWAAQEAGIENIVSEIIRTDRVAAECVLERFQKGRYSISDWPWCESVCLEIAQKLDRKAKEATLDGGVNITERTATLLSWFDLFIDIDEDVTWTYNQAAMVRNVVLHRYGNLLDKDVEKFPELRDWVGKVLPITTERLTSYYNAIVNVHLGIANAIWKSRYK